MIMTVMRDSGGEAPDPLATLAAVRFGVLLVCPTMRAVHSVYRLSL